MRLCVCIRVYVSVCALRETGMKKLEAELRDKLKVSEELSIFSSQFPLLFRFDRRNVIATHVRCVCVCVCVCVRALYGCGCVCVCVVCLSNFYSLISIHIQHPCAHTHAHACTHTYTHTPAQKRTNTHKHVRTLTHAQDERLAQQRAEEAQKLARVNTAADKLKQNSDLYVCLWLCLYLYPWAVGALHGCAYPWAVGTLYGCACECVVVCVCTCLYMCECCG